MAIITGLVEIVTIKSKSIEVMLKQTDTLLYYSVTKDMAEGKLIGDYGKFDPRKRSWYSLTKETENRFFLHYTSIL